MKKTFALLLALFLCLAALAACGSAAASAPVAGSASASVPPAASTAPASSVPVPPGSATGSSTSTAESTPASSVDLTAALAAMVEAAELGATIGVSEIDLQAAGLSMDNVLGFAGAFSQLSAQNGGVVFIIEAKPGTVRSVVDELAVYWSNSQKNEDYAEFEEARNNTGAGVVMTFEDKILPCMLCPPREIL